MPIYVLAGNHRQAEYWARERALSRDAWAYLSGPESVLGLRDIDVVRVGTYHLRDDYERIEIALISRARPPHFAPRSAAIRAPFHRSVTADESLNS